ncbi:MAG: PorV/PorQ family protein [Ignavibacteria bacterium]|nr:PorV/PorQ family protein [Ignavibacteria bacterium]
MKQRLFISGLLLCILMLAALGTLEAQSKRIGTATATELLIPIGARDLARGGSSIADSRGIEAVHWNPAGLGRMEHAAEGMFSSMTYIADIGVNFGGVAASFSGFGVVGFTVKSLDFGDIPLTTESDPEGTSGRLYSPAFVTIGLSYARSLTDAISAGGTVKIVSEQIDRASASGFALDFGVQYNKLAGINGLHLGVAVKNIGPQLQFDGPGLLRNARSSDGDRPEQKFKSEAGSFELPSVVEIGLAYDATLTDNLVGTVSGSFTNNNLYTDEYRVGGELGFDLGSVKLFGRAGLGMAPQVDTNIFGASFGAGIFYAAPGINLTVDYAYRNVDFFDANSVISVKIGF